MIDDPEQPEWFNKLMRSQQSESEPPVRVQPVVSQPRRIQLSRRKGYRKPDGAVRVTRPGKYGNPYRVGRDGTAEECVAAFDAMCQQLLADGSLRMRMMLAELRGKDLACFCALDAPCHADVLLRLANVEVSGQSGRGKASDCKPD